MPLFANFPQRLNRPLLFLLLLTCHITQAAPFSSQKKLLPVDGASEDLFSESIAADGHYVIAGSETHEGTGAAYIFDRQHYITNQWGQSIKLTANDRFEGQNFSSAVDISGDIAVVGARSDNQRGNKAGAVYLFYRQQDTWVQHLKLFGNDTKENDNFGFRVVLEDDTLVVSAYRHNANGLADSGAVYVFGRHVGGPDQWGQITKLIDPLGSENDHFGAGISLQGDTLAIGAENKDVVLLSSYIYPINYQPQPKFTFTKQNEGFCGTDSGVVFIFYRDRGGPDQWGQVNQFGNSLAECGDHFGRNIKLHGDLLATSIPLKDIFDTLFAGMVFINSRHEGGTDSWGETQIIDASDHSTGDHFGIGFDMNASHLVVGAENEDNTAFNAGSAYVFTKNEQNQWQETDRLYAHDGLTLDRFGRDVALTGQYVVIGASQEDSSGNQSGAAYVFHDQQLPSPSAEYSFATGTLTIHAVSVPGSGLFNAILSQASDGQFVFTLDQLNPIQTANTEAAHYIADMQLLHIPSVEVSLDDGSKQLYTVDLFLQNYQQPFQFNLNRVR